MVTQSLGAVCGSLRPETSSNLTPLRKLAHFALRNVSQMTRVLGISCFLGTTAHAQVFYLGIGNDNLQADIGVAYQTMVNYAATPASIAQYYDQTGTQIVGLLNTYRNSLTNGDVLIFHYSGHGYSGLGNGDLNGIADANPMDEVAGAAVGNSGHNNFEGVIGMQAGLSPFNPALATRDDAIAAELNNFAPSVAILSIFDTCHAGDMVDGTADINRGLIIGTADANNCAPDPSLFMPHWNAAFTLVDLMGGTFQADTDMNGTLTLGELYASLNDIDGQANGQGGVAFAIDFGESSAHLNYAVAVAPIPLPAAAWLFGSGLVGLFGLARRRHA